MKYRTILVFGSPGAGKGTQGRVLGTLPHFFHCACGDVFRSLKKESSLGKVFLEYSSQGKLVPDEPTVQLWHDFIESSARAGRFRPADDTLILDGIPRNVHQAALLRGSLHPIALFDLRCADPEVLVNRLRKRALKENRLDDVDVNVIRNRLEVYDRESRPVVDFYDSRIVHEIEASQAPAKVLFDILAHIVKI